MTAVELVSSFAIQRYEIFTISSSYGDSPLIVFSVYAYSSFSFFFFYRLAFVFRLFINEFVHA